MIVSTRGRYALRVLIDLAENSKGKYIPLKDISTRQQISQKYLEAIMTMLSKAGMVDALHGKGGGYRLNKDSSEYKIGDILRLTEGTLAPVACLEDCASPCEKAKECRTIKMWTHLDSIISDYLDSVSIQDLVKVE